MPSKDPIVTITCLIYTLDDVSADRALAADAGSATLEDENGEGEEGMEEGVIVSEEPQANATVQGPVLEQGAGQKVWISTVVQGLCLRSRYYGNLRRCTSPSACTLAALRSARTWRPDL